MNKSEIYHKRIQKGERPSQDTVEFKDVPTFNSDEVENMRRMAERGLYRAQLENNSAYVDMFQHILNCYGRVYND